MNYINNRYVLGEKIGSGSMGVVYKALDQDSNQHVIVKIINLDSPDSPSLDLFKQEFFILSSIRHPLIVHVHDFSEIWAVDGRVVPSQYFLFSMEYVEGTDLITYFKNTDDELAVAKTIVEIVESLHFLHYQGFIHNDIRSNNILVSPSGTIKLIDFSLAAPLNESAQINSVRCANEWLSLIELLRRGTKAKNFPTVSAFLAESEQVVKTKGIILEDTLFSIFNRFFPSISALPSCIKYPTREFTPFNIGIGHQFDAIKDFIDKETVKNKVLFFVGDLYSSARVMYTFSLGYLKYRNNEIFSFNTDNVPDVLHALVTFIMKYDLESKFVDASSSEITSILDRSITRLENEQIYAIYARITSILQKFTQHRHLTISIANYSLKNESFRAFIQFLFKSQIINNLTFVLYNETQDLSLRKIIPEDFYETKLYHYDYLTDDEVAEMVSHCLMLPASQRSSYTDLVTSIIEKTNTKTILVVAMIHELLEKNILTYDLGRYHYDITVIRQFPFAFSFEDRWAASIEGLADNEREIFAVLAYFERNVTVNELKFILNDIPDLPAISDALVKKTLLSKSVFANAPYYRINGEIFLRYIQKNLSGSPKYMRRALIMTIFSVETNPSMENIFFLIKQLYNSGLHLPFLTIRFIHILLDKYDRNIDRKEVIQSIEMLRAIIEKIPHRAFYNNALMHIAIFYYFNNEDANAFTAFSEIDIADFDNEVLLKYYLSFAKNASFLGKTTEALALSRKGKILAKSIRNIHYRYYFMNVLGLIYSNHGKRELALSYYSIVFTYVKKYGLSNELLNFASNFSFQIFALQRYEEAIKTGNELIKALLKDTYHNKLARIYVFIRNSNAAEALLKYTDALNYLDEAYILAKEIQSIDDILSILSHKTRVKKQASFDFNDLTDEQEKIIEIARQYGREIQLGDTYFTLIDRNLKSGELQKSLDYFIAALRDIAIPSKKNNLPMYIQFIYLGSQVFSTLGDFYKAKHLLMLGYRNHRELEGANKEFASINYTFFKSHYYLQQNQFAKGLLWLERHVQSLEQGILQGHMTVETSDIVIQLAVLIECYHAAGKASEKKQCWDKITGYFPDIELLEKRHNDINWHYIRSLIADDPKESLDLLHKALLYLIRIKDFMNVEKVIGAFLAVSDKQSIEYKNNFLLLYIAFIKFYTNTPDRYRETWLNKPKIRELILFFNASLFHKEADHSVLDDDVISVYTRYSHSVHENIKKDNLKIMKAFNKDIWKTHPSHYPAKLAAFLKDYLRADRVLLVTSDTAFENNQIISCNDELFRNKESVDPVLVQNAYHSGDFIIENTFNFGSAISTLVIPVINPYNKNSYYTKDKRMKSVSISDYYLGYIYADSKYPISNINKEAVELLRIYVEWFSSLLTYNLINYELVLDKLTSLFTRAHFLKNLKNKLVSVKEKNQTIAFLIIDIDHFKKVNDTYGHQKGDEVLSRVAAILKRNTRFNDLAGRYGGEEFIVALMNINRVEAEKKAEEIRKIIENTSIIPDRKITVSIGYSMFPEDAEWVNILINKADNALYHAKNTGRNKVVAWNTQITGVKQTKDVLSEILSTDLARSEHIIRSIFELIDLEPESIEHLVKETMSEMTACIMAKYFYYRFEGSHFFIESDNVRSILYDKEKIDELPLGPAIVVNWNYFKEKNEDIHYDLVYKIKHQDLTGLIIFSSPTSKIEYTETHSNLLEKIMKIFKNKYSVLNLKQKENTDQHQ